jgi:hypothetical protein
MDELARNLAAGIAAIVAAVLLAAAARIGDRTRRQNHDTAKRGDNGEAFSNTGKTLLRQGK